MLEAALRDAMLPDLLSRFDLDTTAEWAEVLSADAYAAFEEAGLDQENEVRATGARFRDTVLSLGGSRAPAEVFKAFRGRVASSEALIRHSGLQAA